MRAMAYAFHNGWAFLWRRCVCGAPRRGKRWPRASTANFRTGSLGSQSEASDATYRAVAVALGLVRTSEEDLMMTPAVPLHSEVLPRLGGMVITRKMGDRAEHSEQALRFRVAAAVRSIVDRNCLGGVVLYATGRVVNHLVIATPLPPPLTFLRAPSG